MHRQGRLSSLHSILPCLLPRHAAGDRPGARLLISSEAQSSCDCTTGLSPLSAARHFEFTNSSDQRQGGFPQDYLRTLKARLSTQSESQAALARQQSDRAMQAKQTEVEGLRETLAQDQATLQRYTVALAK